MKKVIRLTESDLVKIVKRVIVEQSISYGPYTYPDGHKYVGRLENGKPNGEGVLNYTNGSKYMGSFKDGKLNGYGTYTWDDTGEYVGDFKDDVINGYGTYTSNDGTKYVGEYKNNKMNGYGTYTYSNGRKYVGNLKDDLFDGYGTFIWPDGRKYVGNLKDDLFDGYGTMTWPDGTKYVGNFENDLFNGYGVYTEKDGTISKGMWEDGKLVKPDGVEREVSSTECNTLKAEADTQEKYNPTNLSSGKLSIGLKNQGPLVKYVQCLLNGKNKELSLGLSDLTVDGIFGNNTKKMVRKFQEKTGGLGTDGVVGKNTFLKLV